MGDAILQRESVSGSGLDTTTFVTPGRRWMQLILCIAYGAQCMLCQVGIAHTITLFPYLSSLASCALTFPQRIVVYRPNVLIVEETTMRAIPKYLFF